MSKDKERIVYGLFSTRDSIVRYIGQTTKARWERHTQHMQDVINGCRSEKAAWIKSECDEGFEIRSVTLLEGCAADVDERRILDVYKLNGHRLTNTRNHATYADRQREGIEAAKKLGKYKGRPPSIDPIPIAEMYKEGKSATFLAKHFGIGRASVYRCLAMAGVESHAKSPNIPLADRNSPIDGEKSDAVIDGFNPSRSGDEDTLEDYENMVDQDTDHS